MEDKIYEPKAEKIGEGRYRVSLNGIRIGHVIGANKRYVAEGAYFCRSGLTTRKEAIAALVRNHESRQK